MIIVADNCYIMQKFAKGWESCQKKLAVLSDVKTLNTAVCQCFVCLIPVVFVLMGCAQAVACSCARGRRAAAPGSSAAFSAAREDGRDVRGVHS